MKNYGLKIDPIGEEDYIFGGFGTMGDVINFSGKWRNWLPKQEIQKIDGSDTWACTTFGTLNCIEILLKFIGIDKNFSDRFLAIGSGTEMNVGNSPHTVAEYLRHSGVCDEEKLPMPKTIDEFYTPSPLPIDLIMDAKKFIESYDFTHSYVFNKNKTLKEKQDLLKDALLRSPIGISVTAWIFGDQYYIKPEGVEDNHWVALVDYEDGVKWVIFDSVDQDIKELAWDYDFSVAKVYYIKPKLANNKISIFEKLLNFLYNIINEKVYTR